MVTAGHRSGPLNMRSLAVRCSRSQSRSRCCRSWAHVTSRHRAVALSRRTADEASHADTLPHEFELVMTRSCTRILFVLIAASVVTLHGASPRSSTAAASAPAPHRDAGEYRQLIDRYCVTCHNERQKTAGLVLEGIDVANL